MIKPIKNNEQYEHALTRTYTLMQKKISADSKESDELEILSILIKEYENEHYPVPKL
jgi:HTH-type transcriptional regulator / antitoxin HigA